MTILTLFKLPAYGYTYMRSSQLLPSLFLVGAPKSGTSALAKYLGDHPEIFVSKPKEPRYWSYDLKKNKNELFVESYDDYLKIYSRQSNEKILACDASSDYLRSKIAIKEILAWNSSAKFIVLLRNPIDAAHAFHQELLYHFLEDEKDFERAWALQFSRSYNSELPESLIYGNVFMYASQIERLFSLASRQKVRIFLFDDFAKNPRAVYESCLEFVGLPFDGRSTYPKINASHKRRNSSFAKMIFAESKLPNGLNLMWLRKLLWGTRFADYLRPFFQEKSLRSPMTISFRNELCDYFRDDVE